MMPVLLPFVAGVIMLGFGFGIGWVARSMRGHDRAWSAGFRTAQYIQQRREARHATRSHSWTALQNLVDSATREVR